MKFALPLLASAALLIGSATAQAAGGAGTGGAMGGAGGVGGSSGAIGSSPGAIGGAGPAGSLGTTGPSTGRANPGLSSSGVGAPGQYDYSSGATPGNPGSSSYNPSGGLPSLNGPGEVPGSGAASGTRTTPGLDNQGTSGGG